MANWKKVIVSGSQASLAGLSGSLLTDGKLLFAQGDEGAITSAANISVNAQGDLVANITGSLNGNADTATAVSSALSQGNGITDFSFDGSAVKTVTVKALASLVGQVQPVTVTSDGVGFDVSQIVGVGLTSADGVLGVAGLTTTEFHADTLIDSSETFTAAADDSIPTVKAVKAYVDALDTNVVGNLTVDTRTAVALNIATSNGTSATIPAFTSTLAGLMTPALSASIAANVLKATNVVGDLSVGTRATTTLDIDTTNGNSVSIPAFTSTQAGLITPALSASIAANVLKDTNVSTSLGYTAAVSNGTVTSDGSSAVIPLADGTNAGLMTAAEKSAIAANSLKTVQGTNLEVEVSHDTGVFTVGLPDSVTITDALTVNGNVILGNAESDTVTINGDLTVLGDTTTLSTTNLLVEDKFILLASGSTADSDGGIIIDGGDSNGEGFIYDASAGNTTDAGRWGFQSQMGDTDAVSAPVAFASAVVVGADNVVPAGTNRYTAKGNMFIAANEDIFIYS